MKAVDRFKAAVDAKVAAWLELGVYESGERTPKNIQKALTGVFTRHPTTLSEDRVIRQLIVRLARELKRPAVLSFEVKDINYNMPEKMYPPYRKLTMPNVKRTEPLTSSLLLAGKDYRSLTGGALPRDCGAPVVFYPGKRTSLYAIYNMEFYDRWIERCRTEDAFRQALGTAELPAQVEMEKV